MTRHAPANLPDMRELAAEPEAHAFAARMARKMALDGVAVDCGIPLVDDEGRRL